MNTYNHRLKPNYYRLNDTGIEEVVSMISNACYLHHHEYVTLFFSPGPYASAIFFAFSLAFGQLVRFLART